MTFFQLACEKIRNYTGGKKTGVKGVPEKSSTRATNMDKPCLRAVER